MIVYFEHVVLNITVNIKYLSHHIELKCKF